MDPFLTTMIGEGATISEIQQAAESRGMRTLNDAGRDLVADAITDIAEYERVLG
jgi:type II secretory ATPase GspE/PulE/Tfp pilus assembly ATPase PilB-like protein